MDDFAKIESGPNELSEDLIERIKPELAPGERLIWAGEPGLRLRKKPEGSRARAIIWTLGLLLLGGSCLAGLPFTVASKVNGLDSVLLLVGSGATLTGVLVAIGMIANLVSHRSQRLNITGYLYVLTDRRAIVLITESRSMRVTVHSYERNTIKRDQLHRIQYPDGSGDVVFLKGYDQIIGFLDVADVRRVEQLVRHYLIAPNPDPTP